MTLLAVQTERQRSAKDNRACFGIFRSMDVAVDFAIRVSKMLGQKMYVTVYKV